MEREPTVKVTLTDLPKFQEIIAKCARYEIALREIAAMGWHPVNGHIRIATVALGIAEETKPQSETVCDCGYETMPPSRNPWPEHAASCATQKTKGDQT